MTFGDAAYYRRQYFAARARANQWEDRAVQDELQIVALREKLAAADAECARLRDWINSDLKGGINDWIRRAQSSEARVAELEATLEELIAHGNDLADSLRAAHPFLVWAASMPGLELETS